MGSATLRLSLLIIHWLENQMIPEKQPLGYINAVFSLKHDAQTKAINQSSLFIKEIRY